MGCCENREKVEPISLLAQPWSSHRAPLRHTFGLPDIKDQADPKAEELIDYILCLEVQNRWKTIVTEADLIASKLDNSIYDSNNIITRVCIALPITIEIEYIIQCITNPELRQKWDVFIEKLVVIEEDNYSRLWLRRIKVLLNTAEFVEKQIAGIYEDQIVVLSYSVDSKKCPPKGNTIRCNNLMCAFLISPCEDFTQIVVVSQTNPKSTIRYFTSSLGISHQKSWIRRFKDWFAQSAAENRIEYLN
jgi:hypothetical protein